MVEVCVITARILHGCLGTGNSFLMYRCLQEGPSSVPKAHAHLCDLRHPKNLQEVSAGRE